MVVDDYAEYDSKVNKTLVLAHLADYTKLHSDSITGSEWQRLTEGAVTIGQLLQLVTCLTRTVRASIGIFANCSSLKWQATLQELRTKASFES